jgi:hypothetical protein
MASVTTLTASTTTPYATLLNIAEAGTAGAAETVDLIALLTAAGLTAGTSPLLDGMDQAFADQAAARAWLFQNVDLMEYFSAASVGTSETLYDANISGGVVANNFRLVITAVKALNTDTYTKKCRLALRMSIVR